MIVYNIKINKKIIIKIFFIVMMFISISIAIIAFYTTFNSYEKKNINYLNDETISSNIANIKPENYSNILNETHKNIDNYVGQKISFSGYVYKLESFAENQFVLARDMDIGNKQTLIIGFLCNYDKAQTLKKFQWVEITGEIQKGNYNLVDIPILNILDLKLIDEPENPSVPMPDDSYVPTAIIY